jgi:hypothetical protein
MGDPVELKKSLMSLLPVKHADWQKEKEWRFINETPNQQWMIVLSVHSLRLP